MKEIKEQKDCTGDPCLCLCFPCLFLWMICEKSLQSCCMCCFCMQSNPIDVTDK